MSDEQQAPADANVGWKNSDSTNSQNYRLKASDYNIADKLTNIDTGLVAADGPKFSKVTVNWPVGSSGAPSEDVQEKTAITWYSLDKAEWYSPFSYKLTINTIDTYDYHFEDASYDYYELNVFQTGVHEVEYDSKNPNIISISGN